MFFAEHFPTELERTLEHRGCRLVGAVERGGHDWIGQDVGTAMGGGALGVEVTDDPLPALARGGSA